MDEQMNSDSFSFQRGNLNTGISTRQLLLSELKKAKQRMISTPHPFCELDCPWLIFCRKFQLSGCILSDLIDSNLLWALTFDSMENNQSLSF